MYKSTLHADASTQQKLVTMVSSGGFPPCYYCLTVKHNQLEFICLATGSKTLKGSDSQEMKFF